MSSSTSSVDPSNQKPLRPIDYSKTPLWKHVEVIRDSTDGGGNRDWVCRYCGYSTASSYTRVKAHLLQLKNQGTKLCSKVNLDMLRQLKLEDSVAEQRAKNMKEDAQKKADYITLPPGSDLVQPKKRKGNQSTLERAFNLKERDELDKEFARIFYSAALPFNLARNAYLNNFCYKLSISNVAGYRPPSYNRLRTTLLAQESAHVDNLLKPIKDSWVKKGVSICSDGWTDASNNQVVNIMGASGKTAVFIDSVDASGIKKDAGFIAQIFADAIDEIGVQKVVQIVTDNGSNFKAAGHIIEGRYPTVFWTPCVVHCVNLAFKSLCKPLENSAHYEECKWLISLCDDINEIQKFVSRHEMVKALFEKYSEHQLLSIAETRFASHYICAQRLTLVKSALDQLVIDPEWRNLFKSSTNPVDLKARKIRMLILDDSWWEKVEYFLEFMKPIYIMIRDGDKDEPMLHLIYDMWDNMIEEIKVIVFKKEGKDILVDSSSFYDAIQMVLEERWNKSNTPLHCLAHSLVPKYYSNAWLAEGRSVFPRVSPHQDAEVSVQRNLCFQRLFPDPNVLRSVCKEYGSFSSSLDFFSQAHVMASRELEEEPLRWWANYGSAAPHLQSLAFRLLSQPASSSCCERNWSFYGNIKTLKRNRLTSDRARDLVKVHNSLRLLARQDEAYKSGPSKYWDIGGDNFNVDADVSQLADLSIDDPELEGVVFDLGSGELEE